MADIIPFKGVLYNRDKINDISKVLAPPYDVITTDRLKTYHNISPYNITHLILPKDYRTSAGLLKQWLKKGILTTNTDEAIYLYQQRYALNGRLLKRLGFIALVKIEKYSTNRVFPHENTFDGPKKDRFLLLKEVKANLCPVFFVYSHRECRHLGLLLKDYARQHQPFLETRLDNETDCLWRISEPDIIDAITSAMQDARLFIADGHHRYEVAIEFSDVYPYVMGYFCDSDDPGLTILPTHRLIKTLNMSCVKRFFNMIKTGSGKKMFSMMKAKERNPLGFYQDGEFYVLNSKTQKLKNSKTLDVSLLHSTILKDINNIFYTNSVREAIDLVDDDSFKAAIFLKPIRVEEIIDCALAGIKLPHKSTYFYPKLMSGLVINKFDVI